MEVLPVNLPPAEAAEYFRRKGYALSFDWEQIYAEEHARIFTVAKVTELDVLEDLHRAVDDAIANGETPEEFRRQLRPRLQERGWWGRERVVSPDGEERVVQLGSPRRLDVIYDTNLRVAHAAGRWEQIERTAHARPYLRYVSMDDGATRQQHRLWHNTVLPVDHPWWRTHFPPNGWRCRCRVMQLSERELERYGLSVSQRAPSAPTQVWTNPRTGATRDVPRGIDPGFDYHPGRAGAHARQLLDDRIAGLEASAPDLAAAARQRLLPEA